SQLQASLLNGPLKSVEIYTIAISHLQQTGCVWRRTLSVRGNPYMREYDRGCSGPYVQEVFVTRPRLLIQASSMFPWRRTGPRLRLTVRFLSYLKSSDMKPGDTTELYPRSI